jgi:hypothetical protein
MKKIVEIALGIVTSVGGFLEIGSITTAAQAGADFSLQLNLGHRSRRSLHNFPCRTSRPVRGR